MSKTDLDTITFGDVEDAMNNSPYSDDYIRNEQSSKYDNVNHPQHYISKNGIETIDVIDAWTEGLEGIVAVDTANVIKYISRWHKKNGIEDLEKAQWYLNHLINHCKEDSED